MEDLGRTVKVVLKRCDAKERSSFGPMQNSLSKVSNKNHADFPATTIKSENEILLEETVDGRTRWADGDNTFKASFANEKGIERRKVRNDEQFNMLQNKMCAESEELEKGKGRIIRRLVVSLSSDSDGDSKGLLRTVKQEVRAEDEGIGAEEVRHYGQLNTLQTSTRVKIEEAEKSHITRELVICLSRDLKCDSKALLKTVKREVEAEDKSPSDSHQFSIFGVGNFSDTLPTRETFEASEGEREILPDFSLMKQAKVVLDDLFPKNSVNGGQEIELRTDRSFRCLYSKGRFKLISKRLINPVTRIGGSSAAPNFCKELWNDVFLCKICPAKFKSELGLRRHLPWHGYKAYRCWYCSKRFCLKRQLQNHFSKIHPNKMPYACLQCDRRFKSDHFLTLHMKVHSTEKPFICSDCNASFKTKQFLTIHFKRKHTKIRPHHCAQCSAKFLTKMELKSHVVTHSDEKPFECARCSYRFKKRCSLMKHLKTHSGEKSYSCPECLYKSHFQKHLKVHMQVHSSEKPYGCKLCAAKFRNKEFLKNHLTTHTDHRPFTCPQCPAKFKLKKCLAQHMQMHSDAFPYSCSLCPMKFKWRASVKSHLRKHTPSEKRFECAHCRTKFKYKDTLRKHMGRHSDVKPFSCPHCPLKFHVALLLKLHLPKHSTERSYTCPQCSAKFKTKYQLRSHRIRHSNERPYSCPQCPMVFKQNSGLKLHLRIHTGEKPYACPECPARFRQHPHLKHHLMTHSKEKPFACDQCPAKFSIKQSLQLHLQIHTGEKKYTCATCLAKFAQSAGLRSHEKTHLAEKPYSCGHCARQFNFKYNLKSHIKHIHVGVKKRHAYSK